MTQPPDWALSPFYSPVHNAPANSNQWQALTADQLQAMRQKLLTAILQIVIQAVRGVFIPGGGVNGAIGQLESWAESLVGGTFLTDWQTFLDGLLSGDTPINVLSLFGNIPSELLSLLPINMLGQPQSSTMTGGTFPDASSIQGSGLWSWDSTQTHSADGTGSMKVTANGTMKAARGAPIAVSQGQKITPSMFVKWTGYTGATASVQLQLIKLNGTAEVGTTTVASITPTAGSGGWSELTGSYQIPSGVTTVRTRLVITADAAAGTFYFDDGTYKLSSNFVDNLTSWLQLPDIGNLFGDPLSFDPTDLIPIPLQGLTDTIFQAISQLGIFGNTLDDLFTALQSIPFGNILGVGGPANIGGSVLGFLDNLIGGFVGTAGTGSSLADVFNIGNYVSSGSALGRFSFDILGTLNNKNLWEGLLPTSVMSIPLTQISSGATPGYTFGVTSTTAATAYKRFTQAMPLGIISWIGGGTTSITDMRINIFQVDPATGLRTLAHASSNIIGVVGTAVDSWNTYTIPTPIAVQNGDTYGAEIEVRAGSGTHTVVGQQQWLQSHPTALPKRMQSVRNPGGSAPPSTIAEGSITYSTNHPAIEFAVETGPGNEFHDTQVIPFTSSSSTTVPNWVNFVDRIAVGPGGGGHGGTTTWGINGEGGDAGSWASDTLARGTDFTGNPVITVTLGTRGSAGAFFSNGGNATNTTIAIAGGSTLTAAGGAGGNTLGSSTGDAAGNHSHNGVTYVGGGTQNSLGADGPSPGSGGGGGGYGGAGGAGGASGAWLVLRQA